MYKRIAPVLALTLILGMFQACILSPKPGDDKTPPPPKGKYENLTEKWHVLNNLELAWNEAISASAIKYEELLDVNYTFFFALGDVGGSIPDQWDRATEVAAIQKMFARETTDENRVLSIDMDVKFNKDTMTWIESIHQDPPYAGETWYTATIPYAFTIKTINDNTYITGGGEQAAYTVRQTQRNGVDIWQLVEFRDLGAN